ncbi:MULTISPECIES: fimbria/pilus periplasmic chaperone [Rahnella]|uniref:Fimbria/pilus periplasmic chaperone n=1 Tax=Rahnella laticis TaxID=2787622 RepID=A0ABS0E280_9GAMM|nr:MULTISPECIES: fimbria/pilus periplasmic chaperone [Rahnella]MBF7979193.1 fimbria/pilus periplasmic chaperone [Rahnella laticis]MBF7999542.1 fimbria/pilus periplasmic chaperone [Rahnella sp. LAC-M12]
MFSIPFRAALHTLLIPLCLLAASTASAEGGIAIGGTRVIYPAGQKEVGMSVRNTSAETSFMIQSWVESPDGKKTPDFIVTPPLFVSGPRNENTLRIMYVGDAQKKDQESLYYFNVKSIPSMDKKEIEGKNMLILAAITRVKLFLRPSGLKPSIEKAPGMLTFRRKGNQTEVTNPSPYYITMAQIMTGAQKPEDTMVPPRGTALISAAGSPGNTISFRTINDYGAVTPVQRVPVQ